MDQSPAALNILHEHVTSKRSRNSPITSLEPVMMQFVELCVDLKKGKLAKDGLYQYKNTAQNTNVGTIEVCGSRTVSRRTFCANSTSLYSSSSRSSLSSQKQKSPKPKQEPMRSNHRSSLLLPQTMSKIWRPSRPQSRYYFLRCQGNNLEIEPTEP